MSIQINKKTVSFNINEKYFHLIEEEIAEGNFETKSEFIRSLLKDWFKTNRSEKIEN